MQLKKLQAKKYVSLLKQFFINKIFLINKEMFWKNQ